MIRDVPVEEIGPGDVLLLPPKRSRRVTVAEVRRYDDGTYVVVYRKHGGPNGWTVPKRRGETWPVESG